MWSRASLVKGQIRSSFTVLHKKQYKKDGHEGGIVSLTILKGAVWKHLTEIFPMFHFPGRFFQDVITKFQRVAL